MFKRTILSVLFLTILACSAYATPIFSFMKLFESTTNKRGGFNENICCFPDTFSMKGNFNQVSVVINNSTLQSVDGSLSVSGDYNTGKIRQDVTYTFEGKVIYSSFLEIKVSSAIAVSYYLQNGKCDCHKTSTNNFWDGFCIPNIGSVTIKKAKIGNYDAANIFYNDYGSSVWLFKEPQMSSDKCWILNSRVLASSSVVQEQMYYDMVDKVDPNVFNIPSQCPSISTCLAPISSHEF